MQGSLISCETNSESSKKGHPSARLFQTNLDQQFPTFIHTYPPQPCQMKGLFIVTTYHVLNVFITAHFKLDDDDDDEHYYIEVISLDYHYVHKHLNGSHINTFFNIYFSFLASEILPYCSA